MQDIKSWKMGNSSIDAVEAAVVVLEDSSLFNAGKGSVYTSDEKQEMDASIMFGKDGLSVQWHQFQISKIPLN